MKHKSFYVFRVTEILPRDDRIVEGLNEKEARRNLTPGCPESDCPKAELLSVHKTFLRALE